MWSIRWVHWLKWNHGRVLQPYTWCIFYLNHQNSFVPHQMVLAAYDLFTNTFTKRKAEQESYPHHFKNRTHLLAESVFLPTVGGEGSLWKKLFIHQYLSIKSGNPAKGEKPTIRYWMNNRKTWKAFQRGKQYHVMFCPGLWCSQRPNSWRSWKKHWIPSSVLLLVENRDTCNEHKMLWESALFIGQEFFWHAATSEETISLSVTSILYTIHCSTTVVFISTFASVTLSLYLHFP